MTKPVLLAGASLAALLLAAQSPALGADEPAALPPTEFRFDVGPMAGGHFFTDDHGLGRDAETPRELAPANAVVFGARLGLHFNRYTSLEIEGLGSPTHTRDRSTDMWIFQYAAQLVIHPWTFGALQPFLMLGYGTIASVTRPSSAVQSDQDGMARAGLGVKVAFGERFGLRVEGRVVSPLAFAAKLAPVGDETNYGGPDFQVVGGAYMNFGEVERQIIVREKVVFRESAVDRDPDRDGIVGDADQCPKVAEDKDGFEDDDGCPESDNDKDGIPDAQDKCPLKAETKNGFEDDDGCPEEDPDGDGFLSTQDQCPTEPETKNGYKDDDGCPDEIPAEITRFTGVIEGINFKTRSTVLLRNSFPILDRAVQVLKGYPDVRLEISGHTDSRGKADFNRDLSQGRAEAVRTYLIKHGINAARLTAIGYGMDQPMATNRTEAGRSKNRRTEFRIMWDTKAPGK